MHRLVDTKASKLDHLRKATHHGPDIPIPTEVNIGIWQYLQPFQCTPLSGIIVYSL